MVSRSVVSALNDLPILPHSDCRTTQRKQNLRVKYLKLIRVVNRATQSVEGVFDKQCHSVIVSVDFVSIRIQFNSLRVDWVICVVTGNIAFKASDSNSIVEHENN
jgi:hypothetical protein